MLNVKHQSERPLGIGLRYEDNIWITGGKFSNKRNFRITETNSGI